MFFSVIAIFSLLNSSFAKIKVVTTTEDLASIAREVGGEKIEVIALAKGYQDPHYVDAKPSHLVKLQRADLFIEVGADLEVSWVPSLLRSAHNPKIVLGGTGFLDISTRIQMLQIPSGEVSRAQGDVHPFGNPHYWIDPKNGEMIAKAIEEKLSDCSPENSQFFRSRSEDFKKRIGQALTRWENRAKEIGLTGRKVVTYHNSWLYFSERFGLDVIDFIEPKPGIPPSPQHLQSLISKMKNQKVDLIIVDPYFDIKLPQKISQETGSKLVILPPSVGSEKGILNYFDLFDRQLTLLADTLKQ